MLKNVFHRYTVLFAAGVAAAFLLLFALIVGQHYRAQETRAREDMVRAGEGTVQVLEAYLSENGAELNGVLKEHYEPILRVLRAQGENAGAAVYIVDLTGSILIASDSSLFQTGTVDPAALRSLLGEASSSSFIESDLGGFLKKETLNYLVLLRKEYTAPSGGEVIRRQNVGAIVFSRLQPVRVSSSLSELSPVPAALLIVLFFVIAGILIISRRLLSPVRQMSEAAEGFAKGDFSRRVFLRGSHELAPLAAAFNEMAESVEKLEESRSRFLADVAHDLRTPVTAISGFAQNMLEGVIPEEKRGRYLKIILDESNRLSRLVGTLLNMSKLDAGERRLSFQTFDLAEHARQGLLKFEERINEKHLEVKFDCPFDRLFVKADPDAIRQVTDNLIDNALKFTPEKGTLSVSLSVNGQKALFSITNTGEGIPEEELSHLFERFYKSDRSRGLDKSGMGLGLYIAKSLIDAHDEEIWVTSEAGSFTEFVFTLKLAEEKS